MKIDISKILFFLTLIFLPQQFGPHFWPFFSFVHGIRVDYLSPSLYGSDVFLLLLFIFSCKKTFTAKRTKAFLASSYLLLFLLIISLPLFFAQSPLAVLFGIGKLLEISYLGLYVATNISLRDFPKMIWIFAVLGALESILSFFEFAKQESLGGVLYFVGERYYTASSLGQAVISSGQGLLVLPYATFSHPNVLSFFLLCAGVLSAYGMHHEHIKKKRYTLLLLFLIIEAGIFITFSRVVILINIVFLLYSFGYVTLSESKKKIKNILFVVFLVLFTLVYALLFSARFLELSALTQSIFPRQDLNLIALSAITSHPLFGLGLNNFFYYEVDLQKNFSSVYLQPVHNVFLLIFSEIGILGGALFVYFLGRTFLSAWKNLKEQKKIFSFSEIPFILLLSLFIVGLFDHFPITIQQGELLSAVIIGLSWSTKQK